MLYLYYLLASLGLHTYTAWYQIPSTEVALNHPSVPRQDNLYDYNDVLNVNLDQNIFPHLGPYAVRHTSINDSALPPDGCTVDLVSSLERHGARHMTPGALTESIKTLNKLKQAVSRIGARDLPSELSFLGEVTISSDVSSLTPYGALQSYYSGKSTSQVYSSLSHLPPFVRASGDETNENDRVIITAQFWLLGLKGGPFPKGTIKTQADVRKAARRLPRPHVILSEMRGSNNTLDVSTCVNFNQKPASLSEKQAQTEFAESTLVDSIGERLASRLKVRTLADLVLDGKDLLNLAQLCSFETLARATIHDGHLSLHQSAFCNMFNYTEWKMLGYAFDVGKWQGFGYGDSFHEAIATGYLRELLARFTGQPPSLADPISLNTTLDGNEKSFPLPHASNGPVIYFDGSHDNTMAPIIASLGLFDGPDLLTRHNAHLRPHEWSFGQIAPFQGKIVFEKLSCKSEDEPVMKPFVRIRANGSIMRDWCKGNASMQRESLCPLEQFTEMISFASSDVEWKKCYN